MDVSGFSIMWRWKWRAATPADQGRHKKSNGEGGMASGEQNRV
jgi:hypothetical protein